MDSIKLFYRLIVIMLLFLPAVYPQDSAINISGFIKEKISGLPLVGTNILVYKDKIDDEQPPLTGTASNNFGFYVIPKISPAHYILIIRHVGFKPVIHEIEILPGKENIILNIEMVEEDIKLEDVIITGDKDEKGNISRIDISPGLLARLPSLTGEVDLFKMLQMLPGVNMANELSNGLYVRGGSPDQTLTLVDGVILYNPAHLGNIASTFNSNAVRDIKLIKGGFPAEYGGRLSSILDIKLRSGTREKEKGIIGLGLINSYLTFEGPLSDKATYMISGRAMYYDVFQKNFNSESIIPRYNFFDMNGKVSYEFSENNILSISGLFNKDRVYSPPADGELDYDVQWENTILALQWLHINSKSLLLNSSISFIDYKFKSVIGDESISVSPVNYFSSSVLTDINFRQDAELRWHKDHTFKTGVELSIHNYDLLYSDKYSREVEEDPFAGSDITSLEAAYYIQNESQFTPLLKVNMGGRVYYFGERKLLRFEPRISASYAVTENIFVKSGFAIAHQFLHLITRNDISLPTDLWFPSTSKIEPGRSAQVVFGIDTYLSEQEYLLSVEAYYKDMKNLYEYSNNFKLNPLDDSIEEQFIKGEGEAYGAELFFNKRAGNLTGWIGYSLSWTRRKFDGLNNGKVFFPRYDRRHDISVVLAYDITGSLTAGLTWIFATGERFTLPPGQYQFGNIGLPGSYISLNPGELNASLFPDYHKLDLNLSYKYTWLKTPFEVYLNLYNVYNQQNPFAQYIVMENETTANGEQHSKSKLKRLTLFPFIPTIGFNIKF